MDIIGKSITLSLTAASLSSLIWLRIHTDNLVPKRVEKFELLLFNNCRVFPILLIPWYCKLSSLRLDLYLNKNCIVSLFVLSSCFYASWTCSIRSVTNVE